MNSFNPIADMQWKNLKAALHWEGTDEELEQGLEALLARYRRERTYPLLCVWCLHEGRTREIGRSPVPGSHGICPEHADKLRREFEENRCGATR